jgi:hypothetical protein
MHSGTLSRHIGCSWAHHSTLDIGGQYMKGVEAPSSTVEVGNCGTWVHLGLEGLESARQVLNK